MGKKTQFALKFLVAFLAGCNYGSTTSNLSTSIIEFYAGTCAYHFEPSDTQIIALLSIAVMLGGCAGSMSLTYFMARYGRKRVAIFCSFMACVFNLAAMAPVHWAYMFVVRIFTGVFSASVTTVVPAWMGEITNPRERSFINGSTQQFVNFGLVMSSLVLLAIDGRQALWQTTFIVAAICCLLCGICSIFLPTPNQYAEQENLVANGTTVVQEISWKEFFGRKYARVVANVFLLNIAEQFSGINAVIMYATLTFQNVFKDTTQARSSVYGSLIITGINMVSAFFVIPVINVIGRRVLWFTGSFLCLFGVILFIIAYVLKYDAGQQMDPDFAFLIAASVIFIFGFQVGPGPVFFVLASEIFPERLRSKCNGVTYTVNWVVNIVIVYLFPQFSGFPWAFYVLVLIVMGSSTIALLFLIPETKGKTLGEIEAIMVPDKQSGAVADSSLSRSNIIVTEKEFE